MPIKPRRPLFRYFGGKHILAQWIISHFPPHRVYVEPFAGSASVLMQKPRSYAEVLNDLNSDIVTTFRVLRDPEQAQELARQIRLTPFARAEFELAYQPADTPMEQARRFICRSAMGFGNGATNRQSTGFRNNTTRPGSTPAGDFASWPDHVEGFTQRLAGVVIEHKPALEVIDIFDGPDTLFYVDPPYPRGTRGGRNLYQHEMSDDDHRKLARRLLTVRGAVIISGYPCALYDDELYSDWRRVTRQAYADNAQARTEVLWLSPSVQDLPLFNGPNNGIQPTNGTHAAMSGEESARATRGWYPPLGGYFGD